MTKENIMKLIEFKLDEKYPTGNEFYGININEFTKEELIKIISYQDNHFKSFMNNKF